MSIVEATLRLVATLACPSWCALPAGHDSGLASLDHASGDRFVGHALPVAAAIGSWSVDLVRDDVQPPERPVEVGDPVVLLNGDHLRPLNTTEARDLAAALVRAADTADATLTGYVGRHAVDSPTAVLPAAITVAGAA